MREKTYALLAQNFGTFVSGEAISQRLGISRAAVQKHIHLFQKDGAGIVSVNNKGHMLASYADRLKPEYILPLTGGQPYQIVWRESAGSTNNEAKALAVNGAPQFTCVTAEEQTGGKGRMGRLWVSPPHKGIYVSMVLRPGISAQDALGITVPAALAVCQSLTGLGMDARIKWPNDILVGGKKICGILTEISANMDGVEYIVCGIGVNVNLTADDVPEELIPVATSVLIEKGAEAPRTKLLADVLTVFSGYYEKFMQSGVQALIQEYTQLSVLHGRQLTLITPNGQETGVFAGFDEHAALLMQTDSGVKRYIAGEISLKGFYK
jgi:BirA family biotin operon repressor/biotin-[acetyl-CoA-carboxylase] ligase